MLTIENLKEYGADVEKGLSRCADKESLYLRLVKIVVDELASGKLGEALDENSVDKAFEIAHKLKGGVSNVALTPVLAPLSELTELLRNNTPGDYQKLYADIMAETEKLTKIVE